MIKLPGVSCVPFSFFAAFVELISFCIKLSYFCRRFPQSFGVLSSYGRLNVNVRCRIAVREGWYVVVDISPAQAELILAAQGNIGSHKTTV